MAKIKKPISPAGTAKKPMTKSNITKSPSPKRKKSQTSKKISTSKKASTSKKISSADDFRRQNIIALFMVVSGMIITLSITTDAMGFLGKGIKAIMLGQFSRLSVLLSLFLLITGAIRLVYSSRFSLHSLPPAMIILVSAATMIFYGATNLETILGGKINFETIKIVFVNSASGSGIGLWPYLIAFYLEKFMGSSGMIIISLGIYMFVGIYYLKWSPSKIGDASISAFKKSKTAAKTIKEKAVDYVIEEDDSNKVNKIESKKEKRSTFKENYLKPPQAFEEDKTKKKDGGRYDFLEKFYVDTEKKELPKYEQEDVIVFNKIPKQEMTPEIKLEKTPEEIPEYKSESGDVSGDTKPYSPFIIGNFKTQEPPIVSFESHEAADVHKDVLADEIVDERDIFIKSQMEKEHPEELELHEKKNGEGEVEKKYILPSTLLLKDYKIKSKDPAKQNKNAKKLEETLMIFGIEAKVVNVATGPTITRYELQPKAGVKVSKILNLSDDLALALAAVAAIRIEAPIPGTSLIGIELPNPETDMVSFKSVLESKTFFEAKSKLTFVLGKDVSGKPMVSDISKMPHMLVAGSTGSGKSVCINGLICSILFKATPDEVKFIMIDPKMVELSIYNDIPHLLIPVVTDMKKAPYALSWAVNEMNRRYKLFAQNRVRDISGYNELGDIEEKMPRIVIIVDELADLMMVSPNEVEDAICRLAQMARACGMHLVLATQRPSVDVITGLIKSNIPSRIAFAVSSQVDSRTILDSVGAEKLIGKGDMLYSPQGISKAQRIQGAFISDKEVKDIVEFISKQFPKQKHEVRDIIEETMQKKDEEKKEKQADPIIEEVIEFAHQNGQISTSLVQRKFRLGYNRASRIIDEMEERGICGPMDGAKPRKVFAKQIEISE
ncbi:DNA translocase FtsK [Proteocatella sphenisci]|uniref:DNA translocase FtsK n=1 Tax=Proteocatella sphenisci TaxID=181070 RepID=UPI0004B29CBC|nr:DNA translocase FtsK [Proteocatella sphenisci]